MKLDELTLQSGVDIPFEKARITIHQPIIKELGYIGENNFHIGSLFLALDKNNLQSKDKNGLENQSNFNIFMSVMNSREKVQHKACALMVLSLLFPEAKIETKTDKILLQVGDQSSSIDNSNFDEFQNIIIQIFCLKGDEEDEYNPADALAKRIADKIKKAKAAAQKKNELDTDKLTIYSKYISILSVGLGKDKNILNNYTI